MIVELLIGIQKICLEILPADIWLNITHIGAFGFTLAILLSYFFYRDWQVLCMNLTSIAVSLLLTRIIKISLNLPRPAVTLEHNPDFTIIGPAKYIHSFPSGHSTTIAAFWAIIWLNSRSTFWRIFSTCLALAVGLSRLAIGAHWPQDIIAGILLGFGITYLTYNLIHKHIKFNWLGDKFLIFYKPICGLIILICLVQVSQLSYYAAIILAFSCGSIIYFNNPASRRL